MQQKRAVMSPAETGGDGAGEQLQFAGINGEGAGRARGRLRRSLSLCQSPGRDFFSSQSQPLQGQINSEGYLQPTPRATGGRPGVLSVGHTAKFQAHL